jgi:hypothetical protein
MVVPRKSKEYLLKSEKNIAIPYLALSFAL